MRGLPKRQRRDNISKKNVSAIVSGAGWIAGFTDALLKGLKKHRVDDEAIHALVSEDGSIYGDKVAEVLAGLMRKAKCSFATWRVLRIGTHKSAESLSASLLERRCRINAWAHDIIKKVIVDSAEVMVDLVMLSVAELGFKDGARYDQICARAKELGLKLCPGEVGLQLRLQYNDQPMGEWLVVAMEPIADSGGCLCLFRVVRDGYGVWLFACCDAPSRVWLSDFQFVFCK